MKKSESLNIHDLNLMVKYFYEKSLFLTKYEIFTNTLSEGEYETILACRKILTKTLSEKILNIFFLKKQAQQSVSSSQDDDDEFYKKMCIVNITLKSISRLHDIFLKESTMPVDDGISCFKKQDREHLCSFIKNDREFFEFFFNCFVSNPLNITLKKDDSADIYLINPGVYDKGLFELTSYRKKNKIKFYFSLSELNQFLESLIIHLVRITAKIEEKKDTEVNNIISRTKNNPLPHLSGDNFNKIEMLKKESEIKFNIFFDKLILLDDFISFGFDECDFKSSILDNILLKIHGALQNEKIIKDVAFYGDSNCYEQMLLEVGHLMASLAESFIDEDKRKNAKIILI